MQFKNQKRTTKFKMITLVATGLGALGVLSLSCQRPSNVTLNISGGSSSGGDTPVTTACAETDFSALTFSTQDTSNIVCTIDDTEAITLTMSNILITSPAIPTVCSTYTYTVSCSTSTSTITGNVAFANGSFTSFTIDPSSEIGAAENVTITAPASGDAGEFSGGNLDIVIECTAIAGDGTNEFSLADFQIAGSVTCATP